MPNVMATLPNIGGALCKSFVIPFFVPRRKVWLMPTTRVPYSNAAKTRNPLKFMGCPKLTKRAQPLVGQSSPYCKDMWGRHCCLSFFPVVDTCLSCKDIARQICAMVPIWLIFLGSCISSEPHTAHFKPAF